MYKILVCDDNLIDRLFFKRVLSKREDLFVDEADSVENLFFILQKNSYDILVLDSILPGAEGEEVCLRLRNEGYELPVIFVSGKEYTEEYKQIALESGANIFCTKPVSSKVLNESIQTLLSNIQN